MLQWEEQIYWNKVSESLWIGYTPFGKQKYPGFKKKIDPAFFQNLVSFHFCLQREMYEYVYFIGHFVLILWEKRPNNHFSKKSESHLLYKVNVVWFFFGLDKSSTQLEFKLQYLCIFVFIFFFLFTSLDFLALSISWDALDTSGDPEGRISPFPENFQTLCSSKLTCPVSHWLREFLPYQSMYK